MVMGLIRMKNEKKGHKEKEGWIRTLGGVLYNCPYLIAMVITSLAVLIYSDEIGIKAIAIEAEAFVRQTTEMGVFAEELSSEMLMETTVDDGEDLENMDENDFAKMKNAGNGKPENIEKENKIEQNDNNNSSEGIEISEEITKGITKFEIYEPQSIDSCYYSDAGKVALTTEYPYTKESISYFNDAIFLGDSRTLGISDYAGLDDADFYCDNGMTIFKLLKPEGVTCQKTGRKEDISFVLQQKQYGKIYIMLGLNELGYGNTEKYLDKYGEVVNQIREWQPDAIIYIMANLHISKEKNNPETEFNNININDKNAASASLANGTDIFYLDANPLFTDSEGFLNAELSFDGVHLYAQHYGAWREFLLEHAVELKHTAQNADVDGVDSTAGYTPGSPDSVMNQMSDDTES